MSDTRIMFLFGAGAEGSGNYGVCVGDGFRKPLLKSQYYTERKCLLGAEKTSSSNLLTSNSLNIYLQTINANSAEAKEVLGEEVVEKCNKYYVGKSSEKELLRDDIIAYRKKWYDNLINGSKSIPSNRFFLSRAVFFDSLDSKFNALRNPELNTISNISKVFRVFMPGKTVWKTVNTKGKRQKEYQDDRQGNIVFLFCRQVVAENQISSEL